ncbi:S41 family peptidase [Psychroflexus salis]|uniref:Peptidase S41 n=1 Tax=Psychroflexus salis TaxID=1526574 RepID=A0A917E7N9_9FLAO|nr:S41 family peptidase [Psychroflexus salis]GGE13039.1 peptidase S41 [Psychroflexus salis]
MKKKIYIALLSFGILISAGFTTLKTDFFEIAKQIEIFTTLFKEVNMNYVDEINTAELMNTAITAMMKDLDPYTQFYNEQDVQDARIQQSANFSSIGASIQMKNEEVVITQITQNGPADKAGLKIGDVLQKVEGIVLSGNQEEAENLLKGSPGSKLSIDFLRNGKPQSSELTRVNEAEKAVPFYTLLQDQTAYIVLSKFTKTASPEVEAALKELKQEGAKQVILDLRNNPGGLLGEAVNVTNIFVPKDVQITFTKSAIEKYNANYITKNRPVDTEIPLAILINGRSASASEIVSGSIQDLDRGVIIGNRSYGKGLVQRPKNLSYGTSAKITISRYYTPSGRCIQALEYRDGKAIRNTEDAYNEFTTKNGRKVFDGGGIMPDVEIENTKIEGITKALVKEFIIFDFATQYVFKNEFINIEDFKLTDKDFKEFMAFAKENKFEFENETEKHFQKMLISAEDEALKNMLNKEMEALENKLANAEKDALLQQKEQILKLLSREIIERYLYEEGVFNYDIQQGEEVKTAQEILTNLSEYNNILQP